jgi:hypothetical protein
MKSLLFVIAAAPLLVSPALAGHDSDLPGGNQDRTCKWCGYDPSYSGSDRSYPHQAQPQAAVSPFCRNVRERVETPKGHLVYRIHRVCT